MMGQTIRIGITDFISFFCREGDISSEFMSSVSAVEGTHLHQQVQKKRGALYQKEVILSITHQLKNDVELYLSGRADGIFENTIEEIKSTNQDLDYIKVNPTHLAQAKLYAYIYAKENQLETMHIQMCYIHAKDKDEKLFHYDFTYQELENFFISLIELFEKFYHQVSHHHELRDATIKKMTFPFKHFRPGQKEMAVSCFKAIKNKEVLFIQAATGIGKTLSTLYPALQSLGTSTSKVMYLTAKTITRQVAIDTLDLLKNQGLGINYVVITAKEKTCFLDKPTCHPEKCSYACGHYDRINDALLDILSHESTFNRDIIEYYAKKHRICPFEFSLDIYNFADVSISDYNYAFDPKVNLKRAFENNNDYTLLVDEAHNLVDRARQMYSATISLETLLKTKKLFKPKKGKLYRSLKKVIDFVDNIDTLESYIKKEAPLELINYIENFLGNAKEILPQMPDNDMKEQLIECFFMLNDVSRISEYYSDQFITYYENKELKLFCLNPSQCLRPIYEKCQSVILFSATLLPISYFFSLNGGKEGDKRLYFASPFKQENQCLLIGSDIQATYKRRMYSYDSIVAYLRVLMNKKSGHYLVYFPSYSYLSEVAKRLDNYPLYIQNSQMTEQEREIFLQEFQSEPDKNKLFLCVLGGAFSEGIDLKGDQVIGVIIVSVGLPQLCLERELIKQHFDNENLGYHYAYVYPGFNKVLQAAGRLIRTMEDRGVVLLLDERYASPTYLSLFPKEWHHVKETSLKMIEYQLDDFYFES